MQSILLVSKNREKAKEYIDKLSIDEKVHQIDINVNSFEKAIGIEEIREIKKRIFLTPVKSQTKIIVIEAYDGITIESQNALLKILEEPPNNTTIIITLDKIGLILPTILSRCKILELRQSFALSQETNTQYLNILVSLSSSGVGERLKLAQDISKNKEEITPELEKMIIVARVELIKNVSIKSKPPHRFNDLNHFSQNKPSVPQYLNILVSLNKTYMILKTTNVSPRLALENLFLNL